MNTKERYRVDKGFTYGESININYEDYKNYIRGKATPPIKIKETYLFEENKKGDILF